MRFDWRGREASKSIPEIVRILRRPGAVAVVPTETVYGLIGRVSDPACREKIYALKHRDNAKPLGWFVASPDELPRHGIRLNAAAARLVELFTPGPLTVIVPRETGETVGFRIPRHPLLLALLKELGEPVFQTSANRSGFPDAPTCDDAAAMLCGTADAVVDGGPLPPGASASTVVDCSGTVPVILRRGALDLSRFPDKLEFGSK